MTARAIINQQVQPAGRALRWLALVGLILLLVLILNRMAPVAASFPQEWNLGLRQPINDLQGWVIRNRGAHPLFTWFFNPLSGWIDWSLRGLERFLLGLPWFVTIAAFFLIARRVSTLRTALVVVVGLLYMGMVGLWVESMQTLALMGVSVAIALLIAIPLGIWSALNARVEQGLRPVLDAMQTMPAFVYLIPVLLFFGVARVPSVVATVIYAIPPALRLTSLGIRQVPRATLEAAEIFGSTRRQILFKVQLPLAMPTILAGVNQTIMMALGIVVIAALIGAGGLGREVLLSLQRLQVGRGVEAGLAIVALAILLDRIGDAFASRRQARRLGGWDSFVLLPASWQRYHLARTFEQGVTMIERGAGRLAGWLAAGVARPVHYVEKLGARIGTTATVSSFIQRSGYLVGSLALLLAFVVLGTTLGWREFPGTLTINLQSTIDIIVRWMRDNLYQIGSLPVGTGPFSDAITLYALNPLRQLFQYWLPWPVVILIFSLVAFDAAGWRVALFTALGLFTIGLLGMWEHSMDTLSQTIVAVMLAIVIAIPLGIWAARNDLVQAVLKPALDMLQTIPSFVFLVPVIMLFNVGRVPGIIASILYAIPPAIRLTNLGIRQVPAQMLEAAQAFGSTSRQTLLKVQLPLALPSIMMGINQTVMMVLAMVIIAGLVGGGGLGLEAVKGLARNETGRGIEAGLAIVILAMILDRITQGWAARQKPPESSG